MLLHTEERRLDLLVDEDVLALRREAWSPPEPHYGRGYGALFSDHVSVFVNIDAIVAAIARHAGRLGPKPEPNTIDPVDWVYDLGENGDLSLDAMVSDNVRDLVAAFRGIANAKGSFATKLVNRDLLDYDPQGRTRIRFSLMPDAVSKVVDVRTSPISERIAAINDFRRCRLRGPREFQPGDRARRLGARMAGSLRRDRRDPDQPGQGAAQVRDHHAHAQRDAPRHEHGLAPEGRGPAVAARPPGGKAEPERDDELTLQGVLEAQVARPASVLA
jgi:hypothetical protein